MAIGFNTGVQEARFELLNAVNKQLQLGVPLSVVDLILEGIRNQLKVELEKTIEAEQRAELEQEG